MRIQHHVSKLFARRHTHDPGMGVKVQNNIFLKVVIAYQINGNGAYNTMRAQTPSLHTPSTPGPKVNGIFTDICHVAYQIKGNGT